MSYRLKIRIRKLLCSLRGHPQFPAVIMIDGSINIIYFGGIEATERIEFSCSCHRFRTHVNLSKMELKA